LKRLFSLADKDNNGSIDIYEIEGLFDSIGMDGSKIKECFELLDTNKSNTIEFGELMSLYNYPAEKYFE